MKNLGFVLFEKLIIIPIGILLVLGASDLYKITYARQVLEQAVNLSLRCLYPRDGDCRSIYSSNDYKYDIYQNIKTDTYAYPIKSMDIVEDRYYLPIYNYSNPTVNVLDNIKYLDPSYPLYKISENIKNFARIKYLVQKTEYPFIDTTYGAFNPIFKYRLSNDTYPYLSTNLGQNKIDISSISGKTKTSVNMGSLTFIPNKLPELNCYKSEFIDTQNTSTKYKNTCSTSTVNLVIFASGKYNLRNSSKAKVEIELKQNGKVVNLGGRVYNLSPGGVASLVPRGVSQNYISEDYNYQEFHIHSPITLLRGFPVTINFKLTKISGPSSEFVDWVGTELKLFGQEFQEVEKIVPCDDNKICSDQEFIIPSNMIFENIEEKEVIKNKIGCASKYELLENGFEINLNEEKCSSLPKIYKCQDNYGIPKNSSRQEILKICGVPFDINEFEFNMVNKSIDYNINFYPRFCNEKFNYKLYPEIRDYEDIVFNNKSITGYQDSYENVSCQDYKRAEVVLGKIITDQNSECDLSDKIKYDYGINSYPINIYNLKTEYSRGKPKCFDDVNVYSQFYNFKVNNEPITYQEAILKCPNCKLVPISYVSNSLFNDFNKAEYNYAFNYTKTALPNVNWRCSDNNCVNYVASFSDNKFFMSGNIKLNLNLLPDFEFNYSDWRKAEQNY